MHMSKILLVLSMPICIESKPLLSLIKPFMESNKESCPQTDIFFINIYDQLLVNENASIVVGNNVSEMVEKEDKIKGTFCKVVVIGPEVKPSEVQALFKGVSRRILMSIGTSHERVNTTGLYQTLFFIDEIGDVNIFCPKLNNTGTWKLKVSLWRNSRLFPPLDLGAQHCPIALDGADLNVVYSTRIGTAVFKNNKMTGMDVEVMEILAKKMNFKTAYKVTVSRSQSISPIDLLLANGSAEFSIGSQLFVYTKLHMLDHTIPLYQMWDILGSRYPKTLSSMWNFLQPFSINVWLGVLFTVVVTSIAFLIIAQVYSLIHKHSPFLINPCLVKPAHHPIDYFIMTLSTLTEPDALPWFPRFSSGKFLTLVWSLTAFLTVASYASNLRAVLVSPNRESFINTPEDMLKRGQRMYIPNYFRMARTDVEEFDRLQTSTQEMTRHAIKSGGIYKVIITKDGDFNPGGLSEDGMKDLLENGAVFMDYSHVTSDQMIKPRLSNLYYGKDYVRNHLGGFKLPKKRPWLEDINQIMYRLQSMGVEIKIGSKYDIPQAHPPSNQNLEPFTLDQLSLTFGLLSIGFVIATMVFILEKASKLLAC